MEKKSLVELWEGGGLAEIHEVRNRYKVSLWKVMRKEWNLLGSRVVFFVSNERRVRFWFDKWCGNKPLKHLFPFLFDIVIPRDAWVVDVWSPNKGK